MEQEISLLNKSAKPSERSVVVVNNELRPESGQRGVKKSVILQVALGIISNLICIAPSMSLGFSAIVLPYLTAEDNPYRLNEDQSSWFASVAAISTPVGCFLAGPISDRFGRKHAFIFSHVVSCVGWVIIAIAYHFSQFQYPVLICGRLITGVSTGLVSMTPTVYMAEVSSTELRNIFTTWSAIFFSTGILVIYFLGFINKENWFLTSIISAAIPIVGIVLVQLFIIESPSWLVSRGRLADAKICMCRLYSTKECTPEILNEFKTIVAAKQKAQQETEDDTENHSNLKYFISRSCLKPFILMLALFFFQQFTGIYVVVFYAINIIMEAGIVIDAFLAAVVIAVTRLIAAIAVGFASRRFGRKPPLIFSGTGMAVSMIGLGIYVLIKSKGYLSPENVTNFSWLPMILLLLYFITSTMGFLPIPFAMSAEVFPIKVRGTVTGVLSCIGYSFTFVTVKIYPNMVNSLGMYGTFFFYGSIAFLGIVFVVAFLPETKGKTLEEIEEYFGKRKKTEA